MTKENSSRTPVYKCFQQSSLVAQTVKHLPTTWETRVQIPGSGRSPGEGNGNPLQYPCLENPMDGEAWSATFHGVSKSRTWLSDFTLTFSSKKLFLAPLDPLMVSSFPLFLPYFHCCYFHYCHLLRSLNCEPNYSEKENNKGLTFKII